MKIKLEIEGESPEIVRHYHEILFALIQCGGLTGVKGGKTIIHFDDEGIFQKIELDYFPWKRRKHHPLLDKRI